MDFVELEDEGFQIGCRGGKESFVEERAGSNDEGVSNVKYVNGPSQGTLMDAEDVGVDGGCDSDELASP